MYKLTDIGKRIRGERQKREWLISQLSSRTELSVAHISSIERGKYNFSIDSLIKIAKALDVDIDYLLFGQKDNFSIIPNKLGEIIHDCNQNEMHIILDNAKSLKDILRRNIK